MHLSLSPNNSVKFTKLETANHVLSSLDQDLMEVEFGVELCTGALLNLLVYGDEVKQGRDDLIECDALSILQRAKSSTRASYRARENVSRILNMLRDHDESEFGEHVLVGVVLGSEYKKGISPLKAELRRTRYIACGSEANSSDDGFYAYANFEASESTEDIETKSASSNYNSGTNTPQIFVQHGNRERARTASSYNTNGSVEDFMAGIENRNIIEM